MSDAKVRFFTKHMDAAEPGDEVKFGFTCPRGKGTCDGLLIAGKTDAKRDPQNMNGGRAQWDWDEDRGRPTFRPSIDCGRCRWYGYVRDGRCVDTAGADEPELEPPN